MEVRLGLFVIMGIVSVSFLTAIAFADSSVEWKSEYRVGILNEKSESVMFFSSTMMKNSRSLKNQRPLLENSKQEWKRSLMVLAQKRSFNSD